MAGKISASSRPVSLPDGCPLPALFASVPDPLRARRSRRRGGHEHRAWGRPECACDMADIDGDGCATGGHRRRALTPARLGACPRVCPQVEQQSREKRTCSWIRPRERRHRRALRSLRSSSPCFAGSKDGRNPSNPRTRSPDRSRLVSIAPVIATMPRSCTPDVLDDIVYPNPSIIQTDLQASAKCGRSRRSMSG